MPLSQVQQQKLTQAQIQLQTAMQVLSSKLVELPLDGLRERVEKELYENPYLETSNSDGGDGYIQDEGGGDSTYGSDYDARKDYSNDDDIPEYLLHQPSGPEVENMDSADTQSFYDQMMEQVAGCSLSEHDRQILEYLIGNLGDDGLLAKPLFQIADELSITPPAKLSRKLTVLLESFCSIAPIKPPRPVPPIPAIAVVRRSVSITPMFIPQFFCAVSMKHA